MTSLNLDNQSKLTHLSCPYNKLTALDLTQNVNLAEVRCYVNQIQGEKMTALVNSLVKRSPAEPGFFYVVDLTVAQEKNKVLKSDAQIATNKNWLVCNLNGGDDKAEIYEGEEGSGVAQNVGVAVNVKVENGTVMVTGAKVGEVVELYDMAGRKVAGAVAGAQGNATVALPAQGACVARVAGMAVKVLNR